MILEELSKKHNKWKSIALKITRDHNLANDIVQEMYLKFANKKYNTTDDVYVYCTLHSIYRNYIIKEKKTIPLDSIDYKLGVEYDFGLDEVEQVITDKLKDFNEYYAELALINADGTSLREIERLYGVNYGTLYYQLKKIKERLKLDDKVKETYYKNIK